MELLQFLYQQRPSIAQREYSHRRRHERPPIPGYPRWRDRLGVCEPLFRTSASRPSRQEAGDELDLPGLISAFCSSGRGFGAQPVPYDWVLPGTPHSERAVVAPDLATFRVPAER